jgi:exonuclease III
MRNINRSNLININNNTEPKKLYKIPEKIKICTINVQSIKNKQSVVRNYIIEEKIDFSILTETWLQPEDSAWKECSNLNNLGLNLSTSDRGQRKGGGLALVYKDNNNITIELCKEEELESFQYAIWYVSMKNVNITLVGVYRPPISSRYNVTVASFTEHFSTFMTEILTNYKNIIITGDFNLHINNSNDKDAINFINTMISLGFQQHVNFATQRYGNTLDLIFSETNQQIELHQCLPGPFITDHCAVNIVTSIKKDSIYRKDINYRKLNDINVESLKYDINISLNNVLNENNHNIDNLLSQIEHIIISLLNKYAPEKRKRVTIRTPQPWFSVDVKKQKQLVRRMEKVWRKNKTTVNWNRYKKERNKYTNMINDTKLRILSENIEECRNDTKKLYQLINSITGIKSENLLPSNGSDSELAEEFSNYFFEKINSIRNELSAVPKYQPKETCVEN